MDLSQWRRRNRQNLDRFKPNRSAMDLDYGRYMLTEGRNREVNPRVSAYQRLLANALNMNRTRILAFSDNPPRRELSPPPPPIKIEEPYRKLDAPNIVNDFRFNLLDWGSRNVLTFALGNTVYIWDANQATTEADSTEELFSVDEGRGPVTSVSWAPDGHRLAVGLHNSYVQLWNSSTGTRETTLTQSAGVCSLAWNNSILTAGAMDGRIYNYDVRVGSAVVASFRGHRQQVCGLQWSDSGKYLASGGNDHLVHVWDVCMANSSMQCLHRLNEHRAAVKALAWSPFQRNLLASGGGEGDQCIKLWNTNSVKCCNSIDTGSQVCALLWNKNEPPELLSSHGEPNYQLTCWKYPSMLKKTDFIGHASSVLFMTQSPDEVTVASAAGDELMCLWNAFEKPAPKPKNVLFANSNRVNIR